jgi:tRNA A37 threonylcarbamoyltransferase TsaD
VTSWKRRGKQELKLTGDVYTAGSGLKSVQQLSAVAVTSGPGLAPCLDVGLRTARQICLDKPEIAFLQINHLEVRSAVELVVALAQTLTAVILNAVAGSRARVSTASST